MSGEEQITVADFDSVDLDSVDLDSVNLDEIPEAGFGEVVAEISEPHFSVPLKELIPVLKVAKQVSLATGRDVISKSISFSVSSGHLVMRVTDFDVYAQRSVPLLNQQNVLMDHVVIPCDILVKLVRAIPAHFTVVKRGDKFFVVLVGGELGLETFSVDESKFSFSGSLTEVVSIPASPFLRVISDFLPLASASVNPQERQILFENGVAYVNFMWSLVTAQGSFPNLGLKVKDLQVLKTLIGSYEGQLTFSESKSSKVPCFAFSGPDFSYVFLAFQPSVPTALKAASEQIPSSEGINIDAVQFSRMVEVAAELPYSVGKVGLQYGDSGLKVIIRSRTGVDSEFSLPGSYQGSPSPLKEPLFVQAKLLRSLLKVYGSAQTLCVSLSDRGLRVVGAYNGVVFVEM